MPAMHRTNTFKYVIIEVPFTLGIIMPITIIIILLRGKNKVVYS